jgi:hypothetical protein
LRHYSEFIVAVQPVALFALLASLALLVRGVERQIVRAFSGIQISPHQYARIGERL